MADLGETFLRSFNSGMQMGEHFEGLETKKKQQELAKQKANVDMWQTLAKSLDLPAGERGFVINQMWRSGGGDVNDPAFKDFAKMIGSEDAATIETTRNILAGMGDEAKNISPRWALDPKNLKELMKMSEAGREKRETAQIMRDLQTDMGMGGAEVTQPSKTPMMPASLTGGAAAPVSSEAPSTPAPKAASGGQDQTAAASGKPSSGTATGGTAAPASGGGDKIDLVAKYKKWQGAALNLQAAGNEKAAGMVKGMLDQMAKQAWTEKFENDHLVRRNAITGEVQSVYQRPEYKSAEKVYHPETGELMGWNVKSSRGGIEFKKAAEYTRSEPQVGPDGQVYAFRNTKNTGEVEDKTALRPGEIRETNEGEKYFVQPTGMMNAFNPRTEYQPGTKERAKESVDKLKEMDKAIGSISKLAGTLDKANMAAKAGDDAGAYQTILRNVRSLAAPILGGEENVKKLSLGEVFNSLRTQAGLGALDTISDRPTIYQTNLMMQASGSETLSKDARELLKDIALDEVKLLRKIYGRAIAFNTGAGDLFSLDKSGRTFQDVAAEELKAWQERPEYKKLEERLQGIPEPRSALRTGVDILQMNKGELENFMNTQEYQKGDATTQARVRRRIETLNKEGVR